MLRFHTQTAGSTLTAQQPDNNIIRTTIQALAAVLGGTQSLHTNSRDEALSLPTEESARTAIRTQQILAYESGCADTVDPLAGSYFIESLTDEIERKSFEYIEKIDQLGGAVQAVKNKYFQNEISRSAYEFQKNVESLQEVVVGVNKFDITDEYPEKILKVDDSLVNKQIERLKSLKQSRDNQSTQKALQKLEQVACTSQNLMPVIIECVEKYATVGEISNILRGVFGEYSE